MWNWTPFGHGNVIRQNFHTQRAKERSNFISQRYSTTILIKRYIQEDIKNINVHKRERRSEGERGRERESRGREKGRERQTEKERE